jgi:hypothetical protein
MKPFGITDESLLAYYENVRRQVLADNNLGGQHRCVGASVKQYADRLKDEMTRRRLHFKPIDWPSYHGFETQEPG